MFARRLDERSIIDSIKNGLTVAVEKLPSGEYEIYGPLRLVSFAYFLLRNFFPIHDEIARRIAYGCQALLNGRKSERFDIAQSKSDMTTLYELFWNEKK